MAPVRPAGPTTRPRTPPALHLQHRPQHPEMRAAPRQVTRSNIPRPIIFGKAGTHPVATAAPHHSFPAGYPDSAAPAPALPAAFTIRTGSGSALDFTPGIHLSRNGQPLSTEMKAAGPTGSYEIRAAGRLLGRLTIRMQEDDCTINFRALESGLCLHTLGMDGTGGIPGAVAFASNGSNSFGNSGYLTLGAFPPEKDLRRALMGHGLASGEHRTGRYPSWDWTTVSGPEGHLLAGATRADRLIPWTVVGRDADDSLRIRLGTGVPREGVNLARGESIQARWFISHGSDLHALEDAYSERLRSTNGHEKAPGLRIIGDNIWNSVFGHAGRATLVRNYQESAKFWNSKEAILRDNVERIFWIDDGYNPGRWGDLDFSPQLFPEGRTAFLQELKAIDAGTTTGLWWPVCLAEVDSRLAGNHPDWFMPGTIRRLHRQFRMLDLRRPEVLDHIAGSVRALKKEGIGALKLDFLHYISTYDWGPQTSAEVYQNLLRTVRQAAGPDMFILGCGAFMVPSLGKAGPGAEQPDRALVDGLRIGPDIALEFKGNNGMSDMLKQVEALAVRAGVLGRVTIADADGVVADHSIPRAAVRLAGYHKTLGSRSLLISDNLEKQGVADSLAASLPDETITEFVDGRDWRPLRPWEHAGSVLQHPNWWERFYRGPEKKFNLPQLWQDRNGNRQVINFSSRNRVINGLDMPPYSTRPLQDNPVR